MSAPTALELAAPAKLNLFLHVTGRRADGYHTLETLLVPIDRCDWIKLTPRPGTAIVRTRGAEGIAPDDDLAVRAAKTVQRRFGVERGIAIDVDKRIPIGGGLGGGSSDAATVLLGLNRLWRLGADRRTLMSLALELGADVPFFVFGAPAFASGVGEALEPVSIPPSWFVVLTPDAHVSTAAIFAASELTRDTPSAKIQAFSEAYGGNDLERVAVSRFPEISACLDVLSREAPGDARVAMSGSGASVFARFPDEDAAIRALAGAMRGARVGQLEGFVARSLDFHPLKDFAAP